MSDVQDEHNQNNLIYKKLMNALRYVQRTCPMGSSNKIADINRTQGWSFVSHTQRHHGQWIHVDKASKELINKPLIFNTQEQKLQPKKAKWYFSPYSTKTQIKERFKLTSPLKDERFNLRKEHECLLVGALFTQYSRQGNCGDLSRLLCKYLWERAQGIHNIQMVKCKDFDHAFVIVNAKGTLNDPTSWGDAWIIDPWAFEGGVVFHASEFESKFKNIIQFADKQLESLEEIEYQPFQGRFDVRDAGSALELVVKIEPKTHHYPSYGTPALQSIDYYYEVCHGFQKKTQEPVFRLAHQNLFQESLKKITQGVKLRPIKSKRC